MLYYFVKNFKFLLFLCLLWFSYSFFLSFQPSATGRRLKRFPLISGLSFYSFRRLDTVVGRFFRMVEDGCHGVYARESLQLRMSCDSGFHFWLKVLHIGVDLQRC